MSSPDWVDSGVKSADELATDKKYEAFRDYYAKSLTLRIKQYANDIKGSVPEMARLQAIEDCSIKYGIEVDKNGLIWKGVRWDYNQAKARARRFIAKGIGTFEEIFKRKSESAVRGTDGGWNNDKKEASPRTTSADSNDGVGHKEASLGAPKTYKRTSRPGTSRKHEIPGGVQRLTNPVKGNVGNDVYHDTNKKY